MKRLSNAVTPVQLATAVSSLALPPPTYGLVPEGWNAEGSVPQFDLEVWSDGTRAITAATLYGAAPHPFAIADIAITSVTNGTDTLGKTAHGLLTGDGPVTLTPGEVAAALDLNPLTGVIETVVEAVLAGASGNDITLALVADGTGAGTLDESGFPAIVFHFESTVTTVGDFENAIVASDHLDVRTNDSNLASTLTAVTDDFAAQNLINGADAALPTGYDSDTDYYVIKTTNDAFKLALSRLDAFAGTAVAISTNGTGTLTLSDTADTGRAVWHSHGLLGPALDGAISLTSTSGHLSRQNHHPRTFAYAVVATLGAGAGLVYVSMVPIVDVD